MGLLRWSAEGAVQVSDVEELRTRLDALIEESRRIPVLAALEDVHGVTVFAWFVGDEAGMTIVEPGAPSSTASEWISVGTPSRGGITEFAFQGDVSELENRSLVSTEHVRSAVLEFFSSGRRPTFIRWEEHAFRE